MKECKSAASKLQNVVPDLLNLGVADGDLVEFSKDFYLHTDVDREIRHRLRNEMADGKGLTISQIREILETTRKYAVPLAEYLDRIGFTRREGNVRVLAE